MIKQYLLKIWKDSVWSKIISVVIITITTLIYNLFISKYNNVPFSVAFINFWRIKVEIWVLLFVLIIFFLFYLHSLSRFKYDPDTLALDRNLFNHIRKNHLMPEFILEIKGNGFSSHPVKGDRIITIIDFLGDCEKPEFEFLNPALEKLKIKLKEDFDKFNSTILGNMFGTGRGDWLSIPSEWEYDQPERFERAKKIIKEQEDILTLTYQNFISQGRNILKV